MQKKSLTGKTTIPESTDRTEFEKEVLLQLSQMLQTMKQEHPECRKQLQEQCQQLSALGQEANLYQWVTLLQTARRAIANAENPFPETAKRIIKDIKRALEKVVAGCGDKIELTQELQTLALTAEPNLDAPPAFIESETNQAAPAKGESLSPMSSEDSSAPGDELLSLFTEEPGDGEARIPEAPPDDFGDYWLSAPEQEARETVTDEFASLFGSSDVGEEATPHTQTEDEFSSLFAETEEPSKPELLDLFGTEQPIQEELTGLDNDWSELSELFEDEEDKDELASAAQTDSLPAVAMSPEPPLPAHQDWELVYYEWDELESLLEQATIPAELGSLERLEALLSAAPSSTAEERSIPFSSDLSNKSQLEGDDDVQTTVEETSATSTSPAKSQPLATAFEQTMRVPVKQLDTLNNLIGELVVNRNTLEQDHGRLRQFLDSLMHYVQGLSDIGGRMQDLYERSLLEGALLASRHGGRDDWAEHNGRGDNGDNQGLNALEMDRFTGFHTLSQEMIELIVRVRESASDIQFLVDNNEQVSLSLQQITSQLQEGLNKARMIPFSQTVNRLPRAVREISRRLNKQAELKVEGGDVLIDKMLLEQLYDPMTHLVNNAITHGIEPPEIRDQKGKPTRGQVTISAFLQGNQTIISVADDGAGIDSQKVRAKAIEKGLISPAKAKALGHQDFYEFLFHPGFSTKDKADDFSGRGVGMDVVRTSLEAIRGKIGIDSTLGKGTTFTVRLPLTLSICKALCCSSDQFSIAFPMDGVEDMQDYAASDIQTNADGQSCVPWRNSLLPFRPLKELLSYRRFSGRRRGSQSESVSIVVLRGAGTLLAVEVERVIGEQEIVIKQIEGPVPKPLGISGATVLGDGSVMAIGDVLELIEIAQGHFTSEPSWQKTVIYAQNETLISNKKPSVLIVDDSITVRELLSISFSNAGYRVEQARDGSEALEKLRSGLACDIIFCDVEMPRMNGLELLTCLQKDERLATIPVALLTSRGAVRHRQVAIELGARGYFTKPYTEKDLLDAAQKMIAGEVLVSGSPRTKSAEESLTGYTKPHSELTVLIIDDSVMVREMLSMTFKKAGYQVEQARDGQDALEKLRSGLPADLVFCDIEMPRMNGLDLLARLHEDPTLAQLPVAMITSRGAERHRKIAKERGAKGYFTKPYIEKTLLEAAKRLVKGEYLLEQSD